MRRDQPDRHGKAASDRPEPHKRETQMFGGLTAPAVPEIGLPKGGGAVRAMGEKFQANPATGTASFTVPLGLTPGRSGFTPGLSLSYDSGAGNGPFGIGWNLGVPSITRRTAKRLPRYVDDGPGADVFVLAGAEDLVPSLMDDGALVEEPVSDGSITYQVRRYRPRIERGYARVERWTAEDGAAHWRVTGPDGTVTIFGRSANARVSDPADLSRVFEWLAEESRDDVGNVVRYDYAAEDTQGVDPAAAHERNRIGRPQAGRLLKRVRYANRVPHQADGWLLEFVVDYGDHDEHDPQPEADLPWPVRPDPYSTYRPGFEVRSWRRARRLLMFHRFPELHEGRPTVVRSMELDFDDAPTGSLLTGITQAGWRRSADGRYLRVPMPALELSYTSAGTDLTMRELDVEDAVNLPVGLSGGYSLVDLDGEGLAGVLTEQAGEWFYKRNLGGGHFDAAALVGTRPEPGRIGAGRAQLLDIDGDGRRSLAEFGGRMPGFSDRTDGGEWARFTPFAALPQVDWSSPDVRFVDLDGDGRADLLIAGDEVLTWYASQGRGGFAERTSLPWAADEEDGPRLVFRTSTEAIHLADMSGDGPADLVRIRAGEVCYWPSLGYGRFGAKVTMAAAPLLDHPDMFDPRRIRLADVDGSGTTDLIYLRRDEVRVFLNACGNSYIAGPSIPSFPHLSDVDQVDVLDLLGAGTGCLVWSSPLPAHAGRALRYVPLMVGKPYLLATMSNGLGARTDLTYRPSTAYYRADVQAGRPWPTRLPFPVHCLARTVVTDEVSDTRLVTEYTYHDGHYDRAEREFRGFAYVQQRDAEDLGLARGTGLHTDSDLDVPPVLTRQWFHTGGDPARGDVIAAMWRDAFQGDPDAAHLPAPVLPDGLSGVVEREAYRALKGQPLRTEVYALDDPGGGLGVPYLVTEHQPVVRLRQQPHDNAGAVHAVFDAHAGQKLEYHYDRNPVDPRLTHELTLLVDDFGVVRSAATIAYPRRENRPDTLDEQRQASIAVTRREVIHRTGRIGYRIDALAEAVTYELTGIPVTADQLVAVEALRAPEVQRRVVEHVRLLYCADDLSGALQLGEIGMRDLVSGTYMLAFTGETLGVLPSEVDATMLAEEGGYIASAALRDLFPSADQPDWWWLRSGEATYDPGQFYLPTAVRDPFGNQTTVIYAHALTPIEITNPVGLTVRCEIDFRVMSPHRITDPNGDLSEAAYDALGRLAGTAVAGDSLEGFNPDLPPDVVAGHLADPLANPGELLRGATSRVIYDLTRSPAVTWTMARERHLADGPASPIQHTFGYTDGLGQQVMTKVRAEAGDAPWREADGVLHTSPLRHTDIRWVGTGRTIHNNKKLPVKKYQPFFSPTHAYEAEAELTEAGVTPILRYDPLGRVIRTDNPDGTFSTVDITAWRSQQHDEGDTATGSRWWQLRETAGNGAALDQARRYEGTPGVTHIDPLGRPVRTVADNGGGELFPTTTVLDIEGNTREVIDARQVSVQRNSFDLLGNPVKTESPDSGTRWNLLDVNGKPLYVWTERGHRIRHRYDAARRPIETLVRDLDGRERLAERTVYGDASELSEGEQRARRLRGRVYQQHDDAGVATVHDYDPDGKPRHTSRTLFAAFTQDVDWANPPTLGEEFATVTKHDALGRVVQAMQPDGSVTRPEYTPGNLLNRVNVTATADGPTIAFVTDISYDAKGQRTSTTYGNGATTSYTYDPLTFRLTALRTTRPGRSAVQDLSYTYDPVGNIIAVADGAQQDVFFHGALAAARNTYTYDPLYRLVTATGREHIGQQAGPDARWPGAQSRRPHYDHNDAPRAALIPHPNDVQAMRPYTEIYGYDAVGNMIEKGHRAAGADGQWTCRYRYADGSNKLLSSSLPEDGDLPANQLPQRYRYDPHGNTVMMPHLQQLDWDHADQLVGVQLATGAARYSYDAEGQRVRAVVTSSTGDDVVEERVYLGGFEIHRTFNALGVLIRQWRTLHVMGDKRRIAFIETKTADTRDPANLGRPVHRYQLGNHLDSSSVELDENAAIISYEEYYPYGSTSFQAGRSIAEANRKRYRYTGKERDAETGFSYHGARYYAPWLARWVSCDPAEVLGGEAKKREPAEPAEHPGWQSYCQLYQYANSNPISYVDLDGREGKKFVITMSRDLADTFIGPQRGGYLHSAINAYANHLSKTAGYVHIKDVKTLTDVVAGIAGNLGSKDTISNLVILTHGVQGGKGVGTELLLPGKEVKRQNAASLQREALTYKQDLRTVQNAVNERSAVDVLACTAGATGPTDPMFTALGQFLGGKGITIRGYQGAIVGNVHLKTQTAFLTLEFQGSPPILFPSEAADLRRVSKVVTAGPFPHGLTPRVQPIEPDGTNYRPGQAPIPIHPVR